MAAASSVVPVIGGKVLRVSPDVVVAHIPKDPTVRLSPETVRNAIESLGSSGGEGVIGGLLERLSSAAPRASSASSSASPLLSPLSISYTEAAKEGYIHELMEHQLAETSFVEEQCALLGKYGIEVPDTEEGVKELLKTHFSILGHLETFTTLLESATTPEAFEQALWYLHLDGDNPGDAVVKKHALSDDGVKKIHNPLHSSPLFTTHIHPKIVERHNELFGTSSLYTSFLQRVGVPDTEIAEVLSQTLSSIPMLRHNINDLLLVQVKALISHRKSPSKIIGVIAACVQHIEKRFSLNETSAGVLHLASKVVLKWYLENKLSAPLKRLIFTGIPGLSELLQSTENPKALIRYLSAIVVAYSFATSRSSLEFNDVLRATEKTCSLEHPLAIALISNGVMTKADVYTKLFLVLRSNSFSADDFSEKGISSLLGEKAGDLPEEMSTLIRTHQMSIASADSEGEQKIVFAHFLEWFTKEICLKHRGTELEKALLFHAIPCSEAPTEESALAHDLYRRVLLTDHVRYAQVGTLSAIFSEVYDRRALPSSLFGRHILPSLAVRAAEAVSEGDPAECLDLMRNVIAHIPPTSGELVNKLIDGFERTDVDTQQLILMSHTLSAELFDDFIARGSDAIVEMLPDSMDTSSIRTTLDALFAQKEALPEEVLSHRVKEVLAPLFTSIPKEDEAYFPFLTKVLPFGEVNCGKFLNRLELLGNYRFFEALDESDERRAFFEEALTHSPTLSPTIVRDVITIKDGASASATNALHTVFAQLSQLHKTTYREADAAFVKEELKELIFSLPLSLQNMLKEYLRTTHSFSKIDIRILLWSHTSDPRVTKAFEIVSAVHAAKTSEKEMPPIKQLHQLVEVGIHFFADRNAMKHVITPSIQEAIEEVDESTLNRLKHQVWIEFGEPDTHGSDLGGEALRSNSFDSRVRRALSTVVAEMSPTPVPSREALFAILRAEDKTAEQKMCEAVPIEPDESITDEELRFELRTLSTFLSEAEQNRLFGKIYFVDGARSTDPQFGKTAFLSDPLSPLVRQAVEEIAIERGVTT